MNLSNIPANGLKLGTLKAKYAQAMDNVAFVTTLIMRGVKPTDLPRLRRLVSGPKGKRVYAKRIIADGKLHEETFKALKELRAEMRIIAGAAETVVRGVAIKQAMLDDQRRQAMAAQSWWHGLSEAEQAVGMRAVRTFVRGNPDRAFAEADLEGRMRLLAIAREGIQASKREAARRAAYEAECRRRDEADAAAEYEIQAESAVA